MVKYLLPSQPDPVDRTREWILKMMTSSQVPYIELPATIEHVEIKSALRNNRPAVSLRLRIEPPDFKAAGVNWLVPFPGFFTRIIAPEEAPYGYPFEQLQKVLGRVVLPWGQEVSEAELLKIFIPGWGKKVCAHITLDGYQGVMRMRVEVKSWPLQKGVSNG